MLGATNMSQTVVLAHFAEPRTSPNRSFMVLKAWTIAKARVNDFCEKRSVRRRVFAEELRALRAAIVAVSSEDAPSSGNAFADRLIQEWAPDVLLPR